MASRRRTARINCPGIARTLIVALLGLVLLAGLVPSGALTASQTCRMECCAGKAPHEAGACSAVIDNTAPATQDEAAEHVAHHDEMAMSVTVVATPTDEHCGTAEHSPAQEAQHATPPSQEAQPQAQPARQMSVAVHALTRPCSMECAAAVLSLLQLRRPRSAAALTTNVRPRPPTVRSRADLTFNLFPSSAERRRQSRPRAPPVRTSA